MKWFPWFPISIVKDDDGGRWIVIELRFWDLVQRRLYVAAGCVK